MDPLLPVLLRPTLWLWWFLHEYPAVKLARWQPEKQERRKLIGKGNYEVAKNNAREGLKNNRDIVWICTFWSCKFLSSNWHKINWKASFGLFGQLWLFCKNEKHPQALKVPLQWACCRSPELCPGPHQMHFPAFVPKSAQNCRSRCCRWDQQTSALCGGKKLIILTLNVLKMPEGFRYCFNVLQETFVLFITHILWSISNWFDIIVHILLHSKYIN